MFPLCIGVNEALFGNERFTNLFRVLRISNIEQSDFETLLSSVGIGIPTKSNDSVLVIRMKISRESWHFELTQDLRLPVVLETDHEEGIDLPESDQVTSFADITSRENTLSRNNTS